MKTNLLAVTISLLAVSLFASESPNKAEELVARKIRYLVARKPTKTFVGKVPVIFVNSINPDTDTCIGEEVVEYSQGQRKAICLYDNKGSEKLFIASLEAKPKNVIQKYEFEDLENLYKQQQKNEKKESQNNRKLVNFISKHIRSKSW